MFGLAKNLNHYKNTHAFTSIAKNISDKRLPNYFVLKLGGKTHYLKFGSIDESDTQFYIVDEKYKREELIWMNLSEKGKFFLPLKDIKLIYYNEDGDQIKEEYIATECRKSGCTSTIDTKSYYTYASQKQLSVNFSNNLEFTLYFRILCNLRQRNALRKIFNRFPICNLVFMMSILIL